MQGIMCRVLHAFIDESYIKGYVYLTTAVVVDDHQLPELTRRLDHVMWRTHKAHGIDPNTELHAQQLFQRSGDWDCFRAMPAAAHATFRNALKNITSCGARVFIRGVREDRLIRRYVKPDPPHAVALQHLLERVNDYATARGQHVRVIADEVQDSAHHDARAATWATVGTPGFRPSTLPMIDLPIQWRGSHLERGLQAADLAGFIYLRKRFHITTDARLIHAIQQSRDAIYPAIEHESVWNP
ncbi:DUF3800 domain-containing protein [Curtobacterium sp. NPDC092190]|uniref:DUF3800 domain-containing protein n=1 Tax=Curtobacterium sp. NPDC092190 TaxID=3363973 RepID=UPI0037FC96E1